MEPRMDPSDLYCDEIVQFLGGRYTDSDLDFDNESTSDLEAVVEELIREAESTGVTKQAEGQETTSSEQLHGNSTVENAEEEEIHRLIAKNENKNTKRSTNTWVRRFEDWAEGRGLPTDLASIPSTELDGVLQLFYAQIRKKNGDEYEPESLKVMQTALNRHLREQNYSHSILNDKDFQKSRKVLNGKAIELQEEGKGKRPRKADPLTENDEEQLWSSGVLGSENPVSLNYTMFFLFSQHFGTRGRQEHHQIRIEDLRVVRDSSGKTTHVEWIEGPTKTRQGGLRKRPRSVTQKLTKTGGSRCPIKFFEQLVSKRPSELKASGPLYLTPLRKQRNWSKEDVWFSRTPVGMNYINKFMNSMAHDAGLDVTGKNFTNHSLRKTTVKKLKKAGVSNTDIMAITGHKSEQSLADYDQLDLEDHHRLGSILSHDPKLPSASTSNNTTSHQSGSENVQPSMFSNCFPHAAPVYFQHCNVYFNSTSCASTSSLSLSQSRVTKRCRPLDTDSDSD